jgi:hypothetical protein
MTRPLPPIIKQLIEAKLLSPDDALSFCTYNVWRETCSCGAIIVPTEDGLRWADLQGFVQNGSHTHAPIENEEQSGLQLATHGLSFSPDLSRVVLIDNHTKNPELPWHDKLMGLGGKLIPPESLIDCMVREFWEESGIRTEPSDWTEYCVLTGKNGAQHPDLGTPNFRVHCYYNVGDSYRLVRSAEPEKHVKAYHVSNVSLGFGGMMYCNCQWLMHMALTMLEKREKRADRFDVSEAYR